MSTPNTQLVWQPYRTEAAGIFRITELELALLGQMPIPGREGVKATADPPSPGQKRKRADEPTLPSSETAPDTELEKKPKLKRSKAKISLSELTEETRLEVAAVVKKTQVLGNRANDNANKEVKPLALSSNDKNKPSIKSAKPESKVGLGVLTDKLKPKVDLGRTIYNEDKENGGPAPAKRTRQVRKVVPVLLDDSYQQSDDGEDSDEVCLVVLVGRRTFPAVWVTDFPGVSIVHARGG